MSEYIVSKNDIYIFNFLPHLYLHDSWWKKINHGAELKTLSHYKRVEKLVSGILIQIFNLGNNYYFDASDKIDRLVLLPPARIANLAVHLGLVFISPEIRKSILKKDIVRYKSELGDTYYQFANENAYAYFEAVNVRNSVLIENQNNILAQAYAIGLNFLGGVFKDRDEILRHCLILKLGVVSDKYINKKTDVYPLVTDSHQNILLMEEMLGYLKYNTENG